MAISKKIWESTRPSECKNSGIGKAVDSWLLCCLPMDKLADVSALTKAGNAEKAFAKAVATAQQKLVSVKPTDKKKAPTDKLLKEWATAAANYGHSLDTELKRRQGEVVKEMDEEDKQYKQTLLVMKQACEDALKRMDTASLKIIQSLNGAKTDAQTVDDALEKAIDAQAGGNTKEGEAAAKTAEMISLKIAARVKEAENEARGAMDFLKSKWSFDKNKIKPADSPAMDKLSDRKYTLEQQIPTNINSIKKLAEGAKARSLETYQVTKGTANKVQIYHGQLNRLVDRLFAWAQERDVVARECAASLTNCDSDIMNYEAATDKETKDKLKLSATENYRMGMVRIKGFLAVLKQHAEGYKKARAALPEDVVNEKSPEFKDLFVPLNRGIKLLNEDHEKVKKAGEKIKNLTGKLNTMK